MTKLIAPTKLSLPLILVIFTILLLTNAIAQADPIKLHPENLYYFLWQGNYKAQGVNTRTEKIDKAENVNHAGGKWTINSPKYTEDVALRILNSQNRRAAVTFIGDFETGDLKGWHTSGNAPKITNSPVRAGKYAMKTSLNRHKDRVFKMGLYKGWKDPSRDSDKVSTRLLYHDEFRMAGAGGQYEDVAPGCDRK